MSERKLATIRQISRVISISNADNIECVQIDGWFVVVKKDEFKVNDLAVYFEIDSILPASDKRYEFLGGESGSKFKNLSNDNGDKIFGYRLRTIKLRKQLSQGLALSISEFPELKKNKLGDDVTDILGVTKYEAAQDNSTGSMGFKQTAGTFPSWIRKTDENRVQNIFNTLDLNSDTVWHITQKLDGSSSTYYYKDGKVGLCSRNIELKTIKGTNSVTFKKKCVEKINHVINWVINKNNYRDRYKNSVDYNSVWHQVEAKYGIFNGLKAYGRNVALQGEVFGENIQGNYEQVDELMWKCFKVWDIDNQVYLPIRDMLDVINTVFNDSFFTSHSIRVPTIAATGTFKELGITDLDSILQYAEGPSLVGKQKNREGVVFSDIDGKQSFKVISNKYLLLEKD